MNMGIEKQGSKGGNYVGSLLHLFDWNAKSRKKLLSNKANITTEKSMQKKGLGGNSPMISIQMLDEDEFAAGSSMKDVNDYSYASSLTDDDFYTSKAPNVVARLMGLDSLPRSNFLEPNSTPVSGCQSFTSSRSKSKNFEYFQDTEPTQKFQTESLQPKSAKSVPITRHKLLSLIKSSNFVSSKDADHIMEAAARIIEPREKTNLPLARSSSMPLKVREPKQKVQVARNPSKSDSNAVNNLRAHSMNKIWSGSVDSENKGKSISLALQAKANVQNRALVGQKETKELNTNKEFTSYAQKNALKKPSTRTSPNVLRQNNQKQNCTASSKKPLPLKSDSQCGKKPANGDFSSRRQRNSSDLVGPRKVNSSKLASEVENNDKKQLTSRVGRMKRSFDGGNHHLEENRDDHSLPKCTNGNVVDSSGVADVVSFTFTAPLTRQGSVGSAEYGVNCTDSPSKWIMLEHDVKGGDILRSTYFERKLKEMTHKREISQHKSGTGYLMRPNVIQGNKSKDGNYADSSLYSLGDSKGLVTGQKFQVLEQKGMHENMCVERTLSDHWLPSPVSVLEHFSVPESCNSSDTTNSSNSTVSGGNHCSSQFQDILSPYSTNTSVTSGVDADLSDSASSTSTLTKRREATTLTPRYRKKSKSLELDYIKELLSNIEPMFKEYALGKTIEIIKPRLFNQLGNRRGHSNISTRLIFDCVNECLDMRFRHNARGGYELWAKGVWKVKRKDNLAEDVYEDICSWGSMGHFMVDEIVDNDMSSKHGTWLDYDIQVFEIGMHIEARVLSSLIDEAVEDILVL